MDQYDPPSMVGQEGMRAPVPNPEVPQLKFTIEDDALLVELKNTKNLAWKQISNFLPGRSPSTLQIRYCTKLKAQTTAWTDDMLWTSANRTVGASYRTESATGSRPWHVGRRQWISSRWISLHRPPKRPRKQKTVNKVMRAAATAATTAHTKE
ncbi:hypothetical protein LTR56_016473 [Elasticomyces elasticus]|nr:hypothetical protein LTR56_016473 [Elasticomyces elasticus]KAK3633479.1 hypothetical protein LTR22_020099 [Elasticomyces elasticus]